MYTINLNNNTIKIKNFKLNIFLLELIKFEMAIIIIQ